MSKALAVPESRYSVPTVAIRKANGKRSVIAKTNFDPKTMRLWDAPPVDAGKK